MRLIAIKLCLMENLSLVAFLYLEIWRHKISLWRREQVIEFGYLTPENGFKFYKNEFLCSESFSSTQNWPPMSISAIFKQRKFFLIFKIFETFRWEKSSSNLPDWLILLRFGQNISQRQKLQVTKFGHHRIRGFWMAAVNLVIPASEPLFLAW